ncbi:MAG: metalloregulator ArsR/SmtB family transcription factor [Candidatus Thermoplasmatota archaeon]|nr:metalloregulator ArsR/SmtB family transcription factor [Candidatus Thermoplasmatota archaeon]MDA8142755.1 metalloregulator ArsR/SmtB family transcription factor [Thermoplasmatales archaeon]
MTEDAKACEIKSIDPVDVDDYEEISELLGVLANKTRIAILSILLKYESVCACELQPALGMLQPTVTTHLQKLYSAGLLNKKNVWRYTYYSIRKEYKELLRNTLESSNVEPAGIDYMEKTEKRKM